MIKLKFLSSNKAKNHVIFVHGFGGDIKKTWQSKIDKSQTTWPNWLIADLPNLNVCLLGYPSPKFSNFWKPNKILQSLSEDIIEEFKKNQILNDGNIILVGHSNGGNLNKHLLRTALKNSKHCKFSESFINRIKGVVFYDTPHNGSRKVKYIRGTIIGVVTVTGIIIYTLAKSNQKLNKPVDNNVNTSSNKKSTSLTKTEFGIGATTSLTAGVGVAESIIPKQAKELSKNNPNLIELKNWFNGFANELNLKCLYFGSNKISGYAGDLIEYPENSINLPINHIQICKPTNKKCKTYTELKNFIKAL